MASVLLKPYRGTKYCNLVKCNYQRIDTRRLKVLKEIAQEVVAIQRTNRFNSEE